MRHLAAFAALLAVAAPAPASDDDSVRCDGGIVGLGDFAVDLLGKCGAPTLRDRWTESNAAVVVDVRRGLGAAEQRTAEVEAWTYDFGTNRFLQVVTLRNGRIVRIERGGYGHGLPRGAAPARPAVSACDPSLLRAGDTQADALGRCGPPAARTAWLEGARVEEWIYNLGPHRFVRVVRFEDGKVARVETGGYGYAE